MNPTDAPTRELMQTALECFRAGQLSQAEAACRRVLQKEPDQPDVWHLLGVIAHQAGNGEAAIEFVGKAIRISPANPVYHVNLGNILQAQGRLDDAVMSYSRALAYNPRLAVAHYNLGNILREQGRLVQAIASYRQAIQHGPDYADAYNNLGQTLLDLGDANEAVLWFQKVLALQPDLASGHYNLGNALREQGKLEEAIACYRKAILLKPDYAAAHNNLGSAFMDKGLVDEAVASFRKAYSLAPELSSALSSVVYALGLDSRCSPAQYLAEATAYGREIAARAKPYESWPCAQGHGAPPLRVGVVSGDFREHAVGFFLEGVVAHLAPSRIELVAYSTNPQHDALTARIKPRFAEWNVIENLGDEAAARKIHGDGIHILIDLAGHTAHNRLPLFAWKPAPVQVSWLGYFATTGVPGMDYFLADPVSTPESYRERFTETIWYLPDTRLCFTAPVATPKLALKPLPAARNGHVTFGCFQRLSKINDGVLAVWGKIFCALPEARLRLQNVQMNCAETADRMRQRLAAVGIAPERVSIGGGLHREDNLAAHAEVDIILDTFPCPGGTTTCEDLWMGVPTLTLAGNTVLARQGASMMACAGLEDWIAGDEDEYVAKALHHAQDVNRLAQLRAELRERVLASPLFDASRFAVNLENALYGMWHRKMDSGSSLP